jgi:hypothetical protein
MSAWESAFGGKAEVRPWGPSGRQKITLAHCRAATTMEQETTDPLAARLLHDIVLDLEAELKLLKNNIEAEAAYAMNM